MSRCVDSFVASDIRAAKRILRYLKTTMNFGLLFMKSTNAVLKGFCDADFAGDED